MYWLVATCIRKAYQYYSRNFLSLHLKYGRDWYGPTFLLCTKCPENLVDRYITSVTVKYKIILM